MFGELMTQLRGATSADKPINFGAFGTRTARVVSRLLGSSEATPSDDNRTEKSKRPTLLEQLKWPILSTTKVDTKTTDEEDVIEKFIRVIRAEDSEDYNTFYNHPARVRLCMILKEFKGNIFLLITISYLETTEPK